MAKKKVGRPRVAIKVEFKSVHVPKALWAELFKEAAHRGVKIATLTTAIIRSALDQMSASNEVVSSTNIGSPTSFSKDIEDEQDYEFEPDR